MSSVRAFSALLLVATACAMQPAQPAQPAAEPAREPSSEPAQGLSSSTKQALAEAVAGQARLDEMLAAITAKGGAGAADTPEGVKTLAAEYDALFAARATQRERVLALAKSEERAFFNADYTRLTDRVNRIPQTVSDQDLVGKLRAMSPPKSSSFDDLRVDDASAMFLFAHKDRFRFVTRAVQGGETQRYHPSTMQRPVLKGEVVLLGPSNRAYAVDGASILAKVADLSAAPLAESFPHPLKPEWLSVQHGGRTVGNHATLVRKDDSGYEIENADFLALATPGTPEYQAFDAARAKTVACFEKEMATLDPSGTRKRWLLETRGGGDVKVEHLADVYDRKACRKCGCARFKEQRRKFARKVLAPLQSEAFSALAPKIERVASLFDAKPSK
jgi:hypothetical protein